MKKEISLEINFEKPISLKSIKDRDKGSIEAVRKNGIYFLFSGSPIEEICSLPKSISYIGKSPSGKDGILGRLKKHIISLETKENDKRKTAAGEKFRKFAERIDHKIDNIYVVCGFINEHSAGLISFAEEWLLKEYETKYDGAMPEANTHNPSPKR